MGWFFGFQGKLFVFLRNFFMYLPAGLFQIFDGGSSGFLESADGFVRQFFGVLEDFPRLLVGFPYYPVAGLVDLFRCPERRSGAGKWV